MKHRKERKTKWWVTLAALGSWVAFAGMFMAWGVLCAVLGLGVAAGSIWFGIRGRFRGRKGRAREEGGVEV